MTHLGKYKLEAEIGRGASGRVYRAFDPGVGRTVAIKILEGQDDRSLLARFSRQASASGRLTHKNIITIFEYVEEGDTPYLVMEYLEGEDLEALLSSGRVLSISEKTSIMAQVADGLLYAHLNGIVHRDIKPANIRVLTDGTVKILDFGMAKVLHEGTTPLTAADFLLGSVAYMAPDVFQDAESDELCDIYSFGVVYFELLTGENPLATDGAELARVIYNIISVEPPFVSSLVNDCPPSLEQLVARAMQKDRELRYQSFEDLVLDHMPIRFQLQSREAQDLIERAEGLCDTGNLQEARKLVLQVLKADSNSMLGRKLLEKINRETQRQLKREKARQLLQSGRKFLLSLEYARAMEVLEGALALDPGNEEAIASLETVKAELKKRERHEMLLAQAQQELLSGQITEAYRCALECLHDAPDDKEATALLDRIRAAIKERERQRRLDESLARAKELLSTGHLDEAWAVLADIELSYPTSLVRTLVAEARTTIQQERQRLKLKDGLDRARSLLANRQWSEALSCLIPLKSEFTDASEIQALSSFTEAQLQAEQRAVGVNRLIGEVSAATESFEFDNALSLIDQGLALYDNDADLIAVRDQTEELRLAHQRGIAIRVTREHAAILVGQNDFSGALAEIDSTAKVWNSTELSALRTAVEGKRSDYEKQREAAAEAAVNLQHLIDKLEYDGAVKAGRQALAQFPANVEIAGLVAGAEQSLFRQERDREVLATQEKATFLLRQGNLEAAVRLLQETIANLGADPTLENLLASTTGLLKEQNKTAAIQTTLAQARELMRSGKTAKGIELLEETLGEYPGDSSIEQLLTEANALLATQQRIEVIEETIQEARRALNHGDPQTALKRMKARINEDSLDPRLAAIEAEIKLVIAQTEKKRAVQSSLNSALLLERQGELHKAVQILEQALLKNPSQTQINGRLDSLRGRIAQQEKVNTALDKVSELISCGQFDEALESAQRAIVAYPDEPALSSLLDEVKRSRQAEAVSGTYRGIEALRAAGNLDGASARASKAVEDFPEEPGIATLKARIEGEIAEANRRKQVAGIASQARQLLNLDQLADAILTLKKAVQDYPGDPGLIALLAYANEIVADHNRSAAIADLVEKSKTLLRDGSPRDAVNELMAALARYPNEESLQTLLERARTEARAGEDVAARTIMDGARSEAAGKGPDGAITILERGVADFPGNEELLDALEEMRSLANQQLHSSKPEQRKAKFKPSVRLYVAIAAVTVLAVGIVYWRGGDSGNLSPVENGAAQAALPRLLKFYADPASVPIGSKTKICYEAVNIRSLSIEPGIGAVDISADKCFEIVPRATAEYRLSAVGSDGSSISGTLNITVERQTSGDLGALPGNVAVQPGSPGEEQNPAQELEAWNRVNKQDVNELRAFAENYPRGQYRQKADRAIVDLELSRKYRDEVVSSGQADKSAIQNTILRYASAMKNKNSAGIVDVYPGASGIEIETSFKRVKEYTGFEILTVDLSFQNANNALVTGTQTVTFKSERGESVQELKPFSAKLQRKGTRWIIISIS